MLVRSWGKRLLICISAASLVFDMNNSTDEVVSQVKGSRTDIPQCLHTDCEACIKHARGKYDNFMSDKGTYYEDGFGVKCPFIPEDENFIDSRLKSQITPSDWLDLNSYKSALLWGEKNLTDPDNGQPWRAWEYQRGPLLCQAPRKVYRFGRRTGKCLPNHSTIALSDGSLKRIGDLVGQEIEVNSLDLETYEYVKAKATVHDNGVKRCVRITTRYGQQIECTLNHPLLTCEGWKSVDSGLQIGDRIAVPITNPNIGSETFDKRQLNLLGYLLGDGSFCLGNNSVGFTVSTQREDVKEDFLSLLDGTYRINPRVHSGCYDIRLHVDNSIVQLVRSTGLINKNSHGKFIPEFVYRLDAEHIKEFLWPLFTTDGWSDNRGNIGYCSASKDLAVGVRRLLSRLGIVASTRVKTLKSGKHSGNSYYVTEINNYSEVCKFLEVVGLRFKGYEGQTVTSRNSYNSQLRSMPLGFASRFAKKLRKFANTMRQREEYGYVREDRQVGREVLSQWAHKFPSDFSDERRVLDSDLYWDEIVQVEDLGNVPTAGLQVPGHQNYVNDVVEHNTTILAVEILWYLFTAGGGTIRDPVTKKLRTNLKVLLLAPQKSHIENIFDRIRAFLAASPALGPCIDRNKRGSPQKITLVTESGIGEGNAVTGFASGDSSGSKGLSARGQDADLIILDEGAFISSEAIEGVVLAILLTRTTTRFIISSTPSGIANDYFEGICTKRPDFAEFYVPSTRHPHWEQMAEQMLSEFGSNQEQYDKEVLAAFSPAGIGVYREDLVRQAQQDYAYGDMRHTPACIYTIGVDWNKEHGTEIVVVATQRTEPHISFIVCSENIPKKENTSPRGISRIVELNHIWQPVWIYVDAGGGDGGQMLRYHGRSMVGRNLTEARLKDIVVDFDFGSKIEILEYNGAKAKVPSKPFMVENSVKKFELGEMKFPRDDISLMRQLNNYIVARRTPSGIPVYGSNEPKWGDHTLDALNLALVAVRLRFPSFQHAPISALGAPIAFIPPKNATDDAKARVILPASTGSPLSPRNRASSVPMTQPSVVKYWGVEPSENAVAQNYRRGVNKRRARYGR